MNWVEQQNQMHSCIEISLFNEKLIIYYFNNVITKTEWRLESAGLSLDKHKQWQQLQQYLTKPIERLTVNLKKQGSDFRHKVWDEMCKIPMGQTLTYSALAKQIDSGARAVANACRDNPFPGIIPCHRVISVSGLGGYMGGTDGRCMEIKGNLLAGEAGQV